MSWWIVILAVIGAVTVTVLYLVTATFTVGARLMPRKRKENKLDIEPHSLHLLEGILWPVAWVIYGGWVLFRILDTFFFNVLNTGEDVGKRKLPL